MRVRTVRTAWSPVIRQRMLLRLICRVASTCSQLQGHRNRCDVVFPGGVVAGAMTVASQEGRLAPVHRHQRRAAPAGAVVHTPKAHWFKRCHDLLRCHRHVEPTEPVMIDRARTLIPGLDPAAKRRTTWAVHGISRSRFTRLKDPANRGRRNLISTEVDHLGHRISSIAGQNRKADQRRSTSLRNWHGTAPGAGRWWFVDAASCSPGGVERSHPPLPDAAIVTGQLP